MAKPHKDAWTGVDIETTLSFEQLANIAERAAQQSTGDVEHGKHRITSNRLSDRQIEFRINDFQVSYQKYLVFFLDFVERGGQMWVTSRIDWYETSQSRFAGIPTGAKVMLGHYTYMQFVRAFAELVRAVDPRARIALRDSAYGSQPVQMLPPGQPQSAQNQAQPFQPGGQPYGAYQAAGHFPPANPSQGGGPQPWSGQLSAGTPGPQFKSGFESGDQGPQRGLPLTPIPPPPGPPIPLAPPGSTGPGESPGRAPLPPVPPAPPGPPQKLSPPPGPPPYQAGQSLSGGIPPEFESGQPGSEGAPAGTVPPPPPSPPSPGWQFSESPGPPSPLPDGPQLSAASQPFATPHPGPPAPALVSSVPNWGVAKSPTWQLRTADGEVIKIESAIVVGRNPAAPPAAPDAVPVPLHDQWMSMSKSHALLVVRDDQLFVTDLHSTNGTRVSGNDGPTVCLPEQQVQATAGSKIGFGEFIVEVVRA